MIDKTVSQTSWEQREAAQNEEAQQQPQKHQDKPPPPYGRRWHPTYINNV